MYKIKKSGVLIDVTSKLHYVKKDGDGYTTVHQASQADGIVVDAVPYNVVGGPSKLDGAEAVTVQEIFSETTIDRLISAAAAGESQCGALERDNAALNEAVDGILIEMLKN